MLASGNARYQDVHDDVEVRGDGAGVDPQKSEVARSLIRRKSPTCHLRPGLHRFRTANPHRERRQEYGRGRAVAFSGDGATAEFCGLRETHSAFFGLDELTTPSAFRGAARQPLAGLGAGISCRHSPSTVDTGAIWVLW